MKYNFISIEILVSFVVVALVYVVGFAPILTTTIQSATGLDSLTSFVFSLVVPCFMLAILIGLIQYSRGVQPQGVYGGDFE